MKIDIHADEVLHYLGAGKHSLSQSVSEFESRAEALTALRKRIGEITRNLEARITPRYIWRVCSIVRGSPEAQNNLYIQEKQNIQKNYELFLPEAGFSLTGNSVKILLQDCTQVVLLACTIGLEFDALLRREQRRNMADAVIGDACGSAYVEAVCDELEKEIHQKFPEAYLTDRFSPGYGDMPLTWQREICRFLDAPRQAGIYVTESLLLNPTKSVTAMIGLADRPQKARIRGCAFCALRENCTLRNGSCGNTPSR